MILRALLVDDEALARSRLRQMLGEIADVAILGEAANGREAVSLIRERRPDLVFLDVQMPEVTGFDVLRALPPETWPAVVFVTAFDQHAIRAFELDALDYLLKPFTQARLRASVERARRHLETREFACLNQRLAERINAAPAEPAYASRIPVKEGSQTVFVRVSDLDYAESAGNYVVLHARDQNHVLRQTLTSLEASLPPRQFQRISRSIVVNLDRVRSLESAQPGEYLVVLQDGRQLLMTRGYQEIQERLQFPGRAG